MPLLHVLRPKTRTWDRDDLVRRVLQAMDIAAAAVAAAVEDEEGAGDHGRIMALGPAGAGVKVRPLLVEKTVAEAAMLMRCATQVGRESPDVARVMGALARQIISRARPQSLWVGAVREPGLALDHLAAHIHLGELGYGDHRFDQLVSEALRDDVGGPERLPSQELERRWLADTWTGLADESRERTRLIARTCVARPLDVLGAATSDFYAFTHVILHATDMGRRSVRWPRPQRDIVADAEAALAAALDADNFDLAAELLWTWPMLGRPWSRAASFGFAVLAAVQDAHGFLPGPEYTDAECDRLPRQLRTGYVLRTSYHATLVMGFLCAAALRSGLAPPTEMESLGPRSGVADVAERLIEARAQEPHWRRALAGLDGDRRQSLAGLVVTIGLRRARAANDLSRLRECLSVALECDVVDGPAVRQALALLRRGAAMARTMTDSAPETESMDVGTHPALPR